MRAVSWLTLSSSACAPVLIFWTNISVFICLLRAEVLSLNPKVDSPRFETCSGKKKFSDFPKCQGCPRERSEGEASLEFMRLLIELFCNGLYFLKPFFNGSIIGQLWSFLFCRWGCPRKTTERWDHPKGDVFLGSKPGPSLFLISWTVSSRLISFAPLVRACRRNFWARSKAYLWLTAVQIPRGSTGLSSSAGS